jgi:hypothetical protein
MMLREIPMIGEPENTAQQPAESDEKQLCLNCLFPNEAASHFCVECGAPLTSYAATGPFEHLFAEGHAYRQAAERPRKLIVVLGIWLVFGMMGLAGATLLANALALEFFGGAFFLLVSSAIIWKTTYNYLNRPRTAEPDNV